MQIDLVKEINSLNPEQVRAISHTTGPMLVLAGAGSGKTKVATLRIAKLLSHNVPPDSILGLTFTNKAAKEMKERVERYASLAVLVTTFHSLGAKILRESIQYLGFTRDFAIYDEDDAEKLLKESARDLGVMQTLDLKAARAFISKKKNGQSQEHDRDFFPLYERYSQKLKSCNAVDFDDLLHLPLLLFKNHPEVLSYYQNRWHYLLVDEYQDTNGAQYAFIKELLGKRNNLFVVGDPDQSIYSWRGANINNILNFEKDFPGAIVVRLEQNYRSTSTILQAANAVITNNDARYEKRLWSALGEGEKITVYGARSERDEASFVAKKVQELSQKSHIPLSKICIFYRTNFQSRVLEDEFLSRKIPYNIVGGISFYLRKEVKDILSMLRLVDNPQDLISFLRAIHLPKRGFGETTLAKLLEAHARSGLAILDFMIKSSHVDNFSTLPFSLTAKQKEGWKEFSDSLLQLKKSSQEASLDVLVRSAIYATRYMLVLDEDTPTKAERLENLEELILKAQEWAETQENPTLSKFLEEISLISSLDSKQENEECVTFMTVHNGKGLEFDAVFLVGVEEDLFPHINCKKEQEQVEEERRLFYVGLTRAKKQLTISYAQMRTLWGATRRMFTSRFLKEIPEQLKKPASNNTQMPFQAKSKPTGQIGEMVFHPQFGVGKIVGLEDSSLGEMIDIFFSKDNVTRRLLSQHAPLSRLEG